MLLKISFTLHQCRFKKYNGDHLHVLKIVVFKNNSYLTKQSKKFALSRYKHDFSAFFDTSQILL